MTAKHISPSRVGRYFFLECPRFLRFSSTPSDALDREGVPRAPWETRPVNRAVLDAGYEWEERALAGPLAGIAEVAPAPADSPLTELRERAHSIEATGQLLRDLPPGRAIYQGTLRPPPSFYRRYGLDPAIVGLRDCRPDLIEVMEGGPGRVLRVTDLKVSRGLRLSHRIQAALYSLLLRDIVEELGLDAAVDLQPAIWLVNEPAPTPFDIRAILPPLEQFLERDLSPLLRAPASEARWLFNPRCEVCPYFEHCRDEMRAVDDVSRVPYLSSHAKDHLNSLQPPVNSLQDLALLLQDPDRAILLDGVGSLRGKADRLSRQVEALRSGSVIGQGGNSLAMPVGEHVRLVFTVQTEPVGGNVYAWAVTAQGLRGLIEPNPFTAQAVAVTSDPDEIRRVERELILVIYRILLAVHDFNVAHEEDWRTQKTLQAYTFDTYEEALLTGVLVRGLSDVEVAEQALAIFFHFQRPELMEASDHPASEAAIPVVVITRVIRELLALPVEVMYRFADVTGLLQRADRPFTYTDRGYFDYELSNQLRPDAVFSLWNEGKVERVHQIESVLRARVWAASSLVDGVRQWLAELAPGSLFAWPPKFRLPERLGFQHPVLSRLAFVAKYESTLSYLQTRQARMAPVDERLGTQTTIELEFQGADRYAIINGGETVPIEDTGFPDRILTPATTDGERAALLFPDYLYRDRAWAPPDRAIALAAVTRIETDPAERPIAVRLDLKASSGFTPPRVGDRLRLDARFVDYNSGRIVDELLAIDRETSPRFVRLLEEPETAAARLPVAPAMRRTALELGRRHGMTPSQITAFEAVLDRSVALTWGPPGTGKTHFVALAILCLAEAFRRAGRPCAVLVTAFTHAAIDNCLRKAADLQRSRSVVGVPIALGKLGRFELGRMDDVTLIEPSGGGAYLDANTYAVLGGTAWAIRKGVPIERAHLVVIDEGSQLKVPEAAIPIRRLRSDGRLLVAGDHLQLPPIVQGAYPNPGEDEPLLHRSIFEALRGRQPDSPLMVSLLENFRMNGTLCRYPAGQIYDPRYDSADDEIRRRQLALSGQDRGDLIDMAIDPVFPLVVGVVDGHQATAENPVEAALVGDIAVRLRERILTAGGHTYASDADFWAHGLFIVSPHHAHINAIRRALSERRSWASRPFVGTVDKMQGQECDTVIASYGVADVEYALSEKEFIYSLNRLNVSITRGRAKTIVFLSRALTEPPIQAFDDDRNAEGIAFMQGLVRFAEKHGEEAQFQPTGGVTLRLLRVPSDAN